MKEIVDNLFIGNKLAQGLKLPRGQVIDLKNIASPLVVFASWGDNITPPEQALDWIIDVYGHESAVIDRGRVIVYLFAQDVGHPGQTHPSSPKISRLTQGSPPKAAD
jgi:poly(3-hydroxyalkanoate) synthetase